METSPVPRMEKAPRASLPAGAPDGDSEESIKYEQQQELEALQQALEHSLRKFTTLYEFAPVGYMSLDRRGRIVKSNIALKVLLGTKPPQDHPTPLVDFITEQHRPRFSAFLQEAFSRHSGKITCELEISSDMPRNNIVRLNAEATDTDEQCMVAAVDITELRLEEQRFHIMADNTYAWEFWLGPDDKFIYMSPSCKRVTGYEASDFLDSPSLFYSIIHPDDRHAFDKHIKQFRMGRVNFQYRIIHKNGSVRAIRHDGRLITADDGTSLGLRGSNLDVTSGWRLKKKLLRSVEELNNLASKLNLSEERERRRIALLLHDQAVQSLAIGKLSLDSALHNGELPRHPVLRELEAILDTTMRDLRLLSLDLSSPNLYDLGLKEAIADLGEKLAKKFQFRFVLHSDCAPGATLSEDLSITVFQFCRELLVNAGKHACAATVTVYLSLKNDQLILNIQDDGKGFKVSETVEGFGIVNIRQRVNHLGGSFLIQSMVGTGTSVELTVKTRRTKKERSGDH